MLQNIAECCNTLHRMFVRHTSLPGLSGKLPERNASRKRSQNYSQESWEVTPLPITPSGKSHTTNVAVVSSSILFNQSVLTMMFVGNVAPLHKNAEGDSF